MVDDALNRVSMNSVSHHENGGKKELAKMFIGLQDLGEAE